MSLAAAVSFVEKCESPTELAELSAAVAERQTALNQKKLAQSDAPLPTRAANPFLQADRAGSQQRKVQPDASLPTRAANPFLQADRARNGKSAPPKSPAKEAVAVLTAEAAVDQVMPEASPVKPTVLRKRPSAIESALTLVGLREDDAHLAEPPDGHALKKAWASFLAANEVLEAVQAYAELRAACRVPAEAFGQAAFDAVQTVTASSPVPHKTKSLMVALSNNLKKRPPPPKPEDSPRVVISGAGPVGLRAAVEAALMGMRVHVVEKRDSFSRVNILLLWPMTADDLMAYGARTFYPKFSNNNAMLHLGTREIQLVLLKNALLLGVRFSYGTEMVAVQAPASGAASWKAWTTEAAAKDAALAGVLDFKKLKIGAYQTGTGQGKCNMVQKSELDPSFALDASKKAPEGVTLLPFDALLLAEGEWSNSCVRLEIDKTIDRFSQAIGFVINMEFDPKDKLTKDTVLRSFTARPFDPAGKRLTAANIKFEFAEYLKGETHYIVVTIKKASLLEHNALRQDLPASDLLTKQNLDVEALMVLARKIATCIGLPEHTQFCDFHPAKLFDFSTRARCLAGFRVLAVQRDGTVTGSGLETHPYLREAETKYCERAAVQAEEEVTKRKKEMVELRKSIEAVEAAIAKGGCLGDMNEAQTQEFLKAQLEGQQRSVGELEKKTSVNEASATTARERQREWLAAVSAFSAGGSSLVPVLPIGDSMLEPFWCAARAATPPCDRGGCADSAALLAAPP